MKHSICLIDDKIPLTDDKVKPFIKNPNRKINSSEIDFVLDTVPPEEWGEKELNTLLWELRKEQDYKLSVFLNPEFFFNHNEYEEDYRPQIIILDWDFGLPDSTAKYLTDLLEFSFSLIFIYTGKDNKHSIEALINTTEFNKYKSRVFVFHKDENGSVEELKKQIDESEKNNFSFSFGQKLRESTLLATDKILIDLGKITVNQLGHYLKIMEGRTRDFIDFLTERFRATISSGEYTGLENLQLEEGNSDDDVARAIWRYRLYNKPPESDNRVLRGDIITLNGTYCLVISADCDLSRFWHKSYGFMNVIPLHPLKKSNDQLKNRFLLTRKKANVNFKHSSLTTTPNGLATGSFILPFMEINGENFSFYGFPKEIKSISIVTPEDLDTTDKKSSAHLKYLHLPNGAKRVANLSEPFLTPLIEHIFSSLAGYGVPDYPESISKLIIENSMEFIS